MAYKIEVVKPYLKYSSRNGEVIDGVVIHADAGASVNGTITHLRKPSTKASYAFLIGKDGTIYKLTPYTAKAWHAGKSTAWNGPDCNANTIGIAFNNRNDGVDPITDAQYAALRWLILQLKQDISTLKYITSHYHISAPRKTDPRKFDLLKVAKETGLTPWKMKHLGWAIP